MLRFLPPERRRRRQRELPHLLAAAVKNTGYCAFALVRALVGRFAHRLRPRRPREDLPRPQSRTIRWPHQLAPCLQVQALHKAFITAAKLDWAYIPHSVVEFVASTEYMVRPPQAAAYAAKASMSSITSQSPSASTSSDNGHSVQPDKVPRMPQETPRIDQRVVPKQSLNEEFFGPSALPALHPTSARLLTPPIFSHKSSYSPPNSSRTLPPVALSRLFLSRRHFGSEDDHPDLGSPPSTRCQDFMHLDADAGPAALPYTDAFTPSPVAARGQELLTYGQ